MSARSWNVIARSVGPPTPFAYSTIRPKSIPAVDASAIFSPVTA
jgi:hypothetical protein